MLYGRSRVEDLILASEKAREDAGLPARPPEECKCEFDPYEQGEDEDSVHYKRICEFCVGSWYGLHCPHDGAQNPCPYCERRPIAVPEL